MSDDETATGGETAAVAPAEDVTATEVDDETPATADAAAGDQDEIEGGGSDTSEDGETGEDDDEGPGEIELDLGGTKVSFAKNATVAEAADKLQEYAKSVQAGATTKFQEAADLRKATEARSVALDRLSALQGEALDKYATGMRLKTEIEQLSQYDLGPLWQSQPDKARQLSDMLAQKQADFQSTVGTLAQAEHAHSLAQEQERSRLVDEGLREVERRVKGIQIDDVVDYVASKGIDREAAKRDYPLNPVFTELAHKAMLWDRMQQQAKGGGKRSVPPAKPVKSVAKRASASKELSPGTMTPGQMAKHLGYG